MASLEQKREAFRKYLESAGAIDCLSKALIRLYQEEQKPEDACKFIRQVLCESCPTDEQVAQSMTELDAARVRIRELEREVRGLQLNVRRTASETNLALEAGFAALAEDEGCASLLKKHLNRDLLDALQPLRTESHKSTLLDCVQSGLKHRDSRVGAYAPDPEAYQVFADLFDPLIEDYHGGFGKDAQQPELCWGEPAELENPDPEGKYILSTRVRAARSIDGFPFHPRMQEHQYEELCGRVRVALEALPDELRGELRLLESLGENERSELTAAQLFKECDRFLQDAQAARFWPAGRAVLVNEPKTFIVWVNEEDHLRVIAMQDGADVAQVYGRFIAGMEAIGKQLTFQRDARLGFVTFCPTNLGTGIRASVHIRLPKLFADRARLEAAVAEHRLQIRGRHGEHSTTTTTTGSDSSDDVLNVSNRRRIGLTEYEAVKEMLDGVKALIELEKQMGEAGEGGEAGEEPQAAAAAEAEPEAEAPAPPAADPAAAAE